MGYLASAYAVTWLLIASYMFFLGKKQNDIVKEIKFLKELDK
jgi:CcmD family protein